MPCDSLTTGQDHISIGISVIPERSRTPSLLFSLPDFLPLAWLLVSQKKVTLSGLAGVELGQGDCNANKVLLNEALPAASATEANRWYSFDELDEAVTSKAGAAVAKLTVERYRAALNRACK